MIGIDLGDVYVPSEDGGFISEKHARISEIINDYDPNLELAWVPPDKRQPGDKPFAVICRPPMQPAYVVFYSDDCDERLLGRLFSMDSNNGNVLDAIESNNAALELIKFKKDMDEREEKLELSKAILRSPLSKYTANGVTYQ